MCFKKKNSLFSTNLSIKPFYWLNCQKGRIIPVIKFLFSQLKDKNLSDSASLGIFNLELIVGRMRKRRLIFGIFSLGHSHRRPHKWVIARLWPELMIPGAYRLDCRVSFLRIQPDLCKFVLSATHLVTAVANRTNIDNIDTFCQLRTVWLLFCLNTFLFLTTLTLLHRIFYLVTLIS